MGADDLPLAAKALALYLTAFGCWESKVYKEFLASYKSRPFPAVATSFDGIRSDGWFTQLLEKRGNQANVDTLGDTVSVPTVEEAWR